MILGTARQLSILLISLIPLAEAVPATSAEKALRILERRQNTCPSSNPVSCRTVDSKLPSNFCCQSNTQCYSLDSSSTALCCPVGKSCDGIQPIDCDVSLMDPKKQTLGPILTTRLNDTLQTCAGTNLCCPFGYSCAKRNDGSAMCQIIANKATIPPSNSSTTPASSGNPSSSNVAPASPSSLDSTRSQPSQTNNPFPPTVFLAGFFPGMLVGALSVLAWVILTGRHKKPDDNASTTSSLHKKNISGPTSIGFQSARTDFLRKSTKSALTMFSKRKSSEGTPGLPFDSWKMPTPPEPNNVPDHPLGQQIQAGPGARPAPPFSDPPVANEYPVTPRRQMYGEPGETIRVYSPRDFEVTSATVAPLRGMHSRDRSNGSSGGNPFQTPERTTNVRAQGQPTHTPGYSYDSAYETLTPARYEGDPVQPTRYEGNSVQKRPRAENGTQQSRPETTFTAMLEAINFPDPLHKPPPMPQMPSIPNQYRR